MKEIIKQISRIDAVAFENEQKNKSVLLNEKRRFENEIKKYRDQKLEIASNDAIIIYNQIVSEARSKYQLQEEKTKKLSGQIKDKFLKVEKDVIKEIWVKLFKE
ncbi:MAG: hypothetical protein Q7J78_01405 [Clostridiales bacterium]|nr:hypothetical protein [Clostridiales bacterium]